MDKNNMVIVLKSGKEIKIEKWWRYEMVDEWFLVKYDHTIIQKESHVIMKRLFRKPIKQVKTIDYDCSERRLIALREIESIKIYNEEKKLEVIKDIQRALTTPEEESTRGLKPQSLFEGTGFFWGEDENGKAQLMTKISKRDIDRIKQILNDGSKLNLNEEPEPDILKSKIDWIR